MQGMLPAARIGAGTGLYNGTTVLLGGIGGSFILGTLVALTGDFQAGILSVAVGAWLVSLLLSALALRQSRAK